MPCKIVSVSDAERLFEIVFGTAGMKADESKIRLSESNGAAKFSGRAQEENGRCLGWWLVLEKMQGASEAGEVQYVRTE